MDDGRQFGPGTTDTSSASKPDPTLQSPGAASLPLGSPNLRSKRNLPLKMFDFFLIPVSKSWLPSVSPRSFYVMLPGWVERRVSYLIYLAGALHIRLPVSAASHTLFPVCWRFSMLAWNKLDRISVKTTGLRCKCWLGTFFLKRAGPVVGDVDRARHQNNWFNTSHHHPLFVDTGCPIWGSGPSWVR